MTVAAVTEEIIHLTVTLICDRGCTAVRLVYIWMLGIAFIFIAAQPCLVS